MSESQNWLPPECEPGLVSVIIPTYNRAGLLVATLESVAAQDYRPIEIQLVDDGSTDNTRGIVTEFIERHGDDSLSMQCHWCKRQGASAARNYGLKLSSGEFVQFLDSDDVLHPQKISTQIKVLKENNADFVWSSTIAYQGVPDWHASPMVGMATPNYDTNDCIKLFIEKSCWRTESGLQRRSSVAKTGPWKSLAMFQDWEYHIRMLSWSPVLHFVPGNFAAANQHEQGRIGDKWLNGSGLEGALKAIQLVETNTRALFIRDSQWQRLLKTRYAEVADQAELLGFQDVMQQAREMVASKPV